MSVNTRNAVMRTVRVGLQKTECSGNMALEMPSCFELFPVQLLPVAMTLVERLQAVLIKLAFARYHGGNRVYKPRCRKNREKEKKI